MSRIVFASTRQSAGKTSIILGLTMNLKGQFSYMKPFGDRLRYHKKQLWDYDSVLMISVLNLLESPENITLGFDHSKLRYMYDMESTKEKIIEMAVDLEKEKSDLFIEGGRDLSYGTSVHLNALSVAKALKAKLILVVSGSDSAVMDDIMFAKKYIDLSKNELAGIILNKIQDADDFEGTYVQSLQDHNINVLGIIPNIPELSFYSVNFLADNLFAKVLGGDMGLNNVVKDYLIGSMSVNETLRNMLFTKQNELVITSGDRSDMILAAIEGEAAGIVITNNILPPSNIISKASDRNIPLLLVSMDTYTTAKKIDSLEPVLMKDNTNKFETMGKLIKEYVYLDKIEKIIKG